MALGTALSRLTGLGRLVALTFALGVTESRLADSFNIANTMPNVLYELVLGGVLTSVFLPVVVSELRSRQGGDAWDAVSSVVSAALVVLVATSVLAALAAPWIVRLFTLRLEGEVAAQQQDVATFLLRFFAPQIAFYGAAAIAGGLLNAHDRFALPMFAPVLNNLVAIATLLAFAALVEGRPTLETLQRDAPARLLLAIGTTAGVAAMALAHWPALRRLPGRLRFKPVFSHPAVGRLARLSGWTLGYVVANQIGFAVLLVLANDVQGGPTAFSIAFAFFQLPYGVVAVSVMTAVFPTLSAQAADGDEAGFRTSLAGGLRAVAMAMIPATAAYLALARPMLSVLIEHGVTGSASADLVASVLDLLALGLVPFAAFLMLMRGFYALHDARTPMLVNLVSNGVLVAGAVALFPALEVPGLALAHSLSYLVAAVVAGVALRRRMGSFGLAAAVPPLAKVTAASAVAGLAMGGAAAAASEQAIVALVAGGAVGAVTFLVLARLLGVEELSALSRLLPRR